jgi:deazaflavin-dependent oxidoreductase (nitroreductase family)
MAVATPARRCARSSAASYCPPNGVVKTTRLARREAGCDNRRPMWPVTRRALRFFRESGLWRLVSKVHTWVYRATKGRLGHQAAGLASLLLVTRGRRSGVERTVALTYVPDGRDYVVVASNGGADRHPAWWLNLRADPRATVQVGPELVPIVAHEATSEERRRLWPILTAANPFYTRYELLTSRPIPVVVLRPTTRP